MHLACRETETLGAQSIIRRASDIICQNNVRSRSFTTNEKVWFHSHLHGCHPGSVASIDPPAINILLEQQNYPNHDTQFRPFFAEIAIPPAMKRDQFVQDLPITQALTVTRTQIRAMISIAAFFKPFFVSIHKQVNHISDTELPVTSYKLCIYQTKRMDINSDSVYFIVAKLVKDEPTMTQDDEDALEVAKRGEVE